MTGATDKADACDLGCFAQLHDELAESPDDVVAVQRCRHDQMLAKVSRHTRTPRAANSSGTSDSAGPDQPDRRQVCEGY